MSHSTLPIIAPAPPLPLKPLFNNNNDYRKIALNTTNTKIQIDECLWALQYPELQKSSFLARVCTQQPPRSCKFYNIPGILQVGPTCGFVALSMFWNGNPTAEELFATAQKLQYTNNGEMYSAQQLFQLVCNQINVPSLANSCELYKGELNCTPIKDLLLEGACLFVPYDSDYNHAPCIKFGHKAHWALIIGYLISDDDEFYVLARHGKAKNIAVWSLKALSESNANLIEFAQPKAYPDCNFLLPPGGISGDLGLRERAIIVKGSTHEIITIK